MNAKLVRNSFIPKKREVLIALRGTIFTLTSDIAMKGLSGTINDIKPSLQTSRERGTEARLQIKRGIRGTERSLAEPAEGIVFSMELQYSSEAPQKCYNSTSADRLWASDRQYFVADIFVFAECGLSSAKIIYVQPEPFPIDDDIFAKLTASEFTINVTTKITADGIKSFVGGLASGKHEVVKG
nr:unnamed protein product [Haemonchus contortus]